MQTKALLINKQITHGRNTTIPVCGFILTLCDPTARMYCLSDWHWLRWQHCIFFHSLTFEVISQFPPLGSPADGGLWSAQPVTDSLSSWLMTLIEIHFLSIRVWHLLPDKSPSLVYLCLDSKQGLFTCRNRVYCWWHPCPHVSRKVRPDDFFMRQSGKHRDKREEWVRVGRQSEGR